MTDVTARSAIVILNKARKKIRAGWCQNRNRWKHPRYGNVQMCLSEALIESSNKFLASTLAFNLVEEQIPSGYSNIADWNDGPRRTKSQVLALLNRAVAEARKL